MNKVISISLLVGLMLSAVRFSAPYLWYYSNYDYINQELCENRDKPHLECNGFCQLKKKVHENHGDSENEAKPIIHKQNIHHFLISDSVSEIIPPKIKQEIPLYNQSSKSLWISEPVSPPPQSVFDISFSF